MQGNMSKHNRPAVDEAIAPRGGTSRGGQPLSHNRAPAADLSPWIARLYAAIVDHPAGRRIDCGLFNDTGFLRVQLAGAWTAQTRDGLLEYQQSSLFFGPQSRRMSVSVASSFVSLGISFRPGACHALWRLKIASYLDRIVPSEAILPQSAGLADRIDPSGTPEQWLNMLEALMRAEIERTAAAAPHAATAQFEAAAFSNPNINISQFADDIGIVRRQLERIIRRDFGMSPKQVLRRARALDMASHLRGVGDHAEATDVASRYYDQSHLIREFDNLFGMAPTEFVAKPQPLLTLTLESRQARRLEAINRLAPGAVRPWQ